MASVQTDKTAFTTCQLEEIRKASLARVICSNSDNIAAIARDPMRLLKRSLRAREDQGVRDMVSCDELPDVNLEAWKDSFKCKQV